MLKSKVILEELSKLQSNLVEQKDSTQQMIRQLDIQQQDLAQQMMQQLSIQQNEQEQHVLQRKWIEEILQCIGAEKTFLSALSEKMDKQLAFQINDQKKTYEEYLDYKVKEIQILIENLAKQFDANKGEIIESIVENNNKFIIGLSEQTHKNKLELINVISENKNEIEESIDKSIQIGGSRHNAIVNILSEKENDEEPINVGSIKKIIKNKWELIDKFYREPEILECIICKENVNTNKAEKLSSECIYGGGKLIRYKCPKCGCVFGPGKMLELSETELSEEYKIHYNAYDEGMTEEAEIKTFYSLKPVRGKRYLNYGAGAWNQTIMRLRNDGYDVYGYDPYAPSSNEYIIKDIEILEKMKFDGIFSHDLLEHLAKPLEIFTTFKKILNEDGKMAHATACYKYVYEYTRFHLVFYTGTAVDYLCKECGIRVLEKEIDSENLYINYIYEVEK